MKKFLTVFFVLLMSMTAYATPPSFYLQGQLNSELMVITENTPVGVKNEEVVYTFTDIPEGAEAGSGETIHSYTSMPEEITGLDYRISSTYHLANETDSEQTVKLALPFSGNYSHISNKDVNMQFDGEDIPFDLLFMPLPVPRPHDEDVNGEVFDYQELAKLVKNGGDYKPKSFAEDDIGTLYTYVVTARDINARFEVTLINDANKRQKIIYYGFTDDDSGSSEGEIKLTFELGKYTFKGNPESRELGIFIIGDSVQPSYRLIQPDYETYENGRTPSIDCKFSSETLSVTDYISRIQKKFEPNTDVAEIPQAVLMGRLDMMLQKEYKNYVDIYTDVNRPWISYMNEIYVLSFSVTLPPNSERTLVVNSIAQPEIDGAYSGAWLYTFKHIFVLPNQWSYFDKMTVDVYTPSSRKYLIKNNYKFKDISKNNSLYRAEIKGKPTQDLLFSIYPSKRAAKPNYLLAFILVLILYFIVKYWWLIILVIAACIYLKKKRRKQKAEKESVGKE